eukprot:scaffold34274_cov93-Phaeocystis_antarctica.AAC.1
MCCELHTAGRCALSFDQGCVVFMPSDSSDTRLDAHVQQLTTLNYYQIAFRTGTGLSTHAGLFHEVDSC